MHFYNSIWKCFCCALLDSAQQKPSLWKVIILYRNMLLQIGMGSMLKLLREFINQTGFALWYKNNNWSKSYDKTSAIQWKHLWLTWKSFKMEKDKRSSGNFYESWMKFCQKGVHAVIKLQTSHIDWQRQKMYCWQPWLLAAMLLIPLGSAGQNSPCLGSEAIKEYIRCGFSTNCSQQLFTTG